MSDIIARPGGALASRPLHFFWVVDCSGSMWGEKIGVVNNAIQSVLPDMIDEAANNPNAQLMIRTLKFSTGASWVTENPVKVEEYVWEDLDAGGVTDLGKAFDLLAAQLDIKQMGDRALPPVIVLLSDGQPTDDYKKSLEKLQKLPWVRKAVKIAISIGQDADDDVLIEFTGNTELVLQANNSKMLAKMIKWASTAVSAVSSGVSNTSESDSNNTPDNSIPSGGNGPLILDMDNIPEPGDIDSGDVW
ncbi:MAG: VWA domain-containing protein [Oscillospiraceae bacterium]